MAKLQKTLYRLPREGKIAGVCAGLSDYFEFDVTLMRLIWVVAAITSGGFVVFIYIVLAVILPVSTGGSMKARVVNEHESINEKVTQLGHDLQDSHVLTRTRNYLGFGLVLLGAWLLLEQFAPSWFDLRWDYIWPVILIVLGLMIVVGKKR